jgi:hypothetical protein
VAGSSQYDEEPSTATKYSEFVYWPKDCYLLGKVLKHGICTYKTFHNTQMDYSNELIFLLSHYVVIFYVQK